MGCVFTVAVTTSNFMWNSDTNWHTDNSLSCLCTRDAGSWRNDGNCTEMSALSVSHASWEVERWTHIAAAVEKVWLRNLRMTPNDVLDTIHKLRFLLAAPSKAWVCGHSLAGIAGSNPAGSVDVSFLWVLRVVG